MMEARRVYYEPLGRKTTFRMQIGQLTMTSLSQTNEMTYRLGWRFDAPQRQIWATAYLNVTLLFRMKVSVKPKRVKSL